MKDDIIILTLGFAGSLMAVISPILKLNSTITKLNVTMENVNEKIIKNDDNLGKHEEHSIQKFSCVDNKLDEHEIRIVKLEEKNKRKV